MLSNIISASLLGFSCLSSVASAAPFKFAAEGFPYSFDLNAIELAAHGTVPNGKYVDHPTIAKHY